MVRVRVSVSMSMSMSISISVSIQNCEKIGSIPGYYDANPDVTECRQYYLTVPRLLQKSYMQVTSTYGRIVIIT
jgi:hypothetical protein